MLCVSCVSFNVNYYSRNPFIWLRQMSKEVVACDSGDINGNYCMNKTLHVLFDNSISANKTAGVPGLLPITALTALIEMAT